MYGLLSFTGPFSAQYFNMYKYNCMITTVPAKQPRRIWCDMKHMKPLCGIIMIIITHLHPNLLPQPTPTPSPNIHPPETNYIQIVYHIMCFYWENKTLELELQIPHLIGLVIPE